MTKKILLGFSLLILFGIIGLGFWFVRQRFSGPSESSDQLTFIPKKTVTTLLQRGETAPTESAMASFSGTLKKLPKCLGNLVCFQVGKNYVTELTAEQIGKWPVQFTDSYLNKYVGQFVRVHGKMVLPSGDRPVYYRVYELEIQ